MSGPACGPNDAITSDAADAAGALALARASIAYHLLGARDDDGGDGGATPGMRLGNVVLHPHQCAALPRLRHALRTLGGALLADEAGLGKTYVALALAREARAPLLVAPAALRDTWRAAMRRSGVSVPFVSHEALSRRGSEGVGVRPDLLVVDEAHHARTRRTRRWHALASLADGARVLLLSATPVHNRRAELASLLALFMGERARDAPDALLARCVVRRERADVTGSLPISCRAAGDDVARDDEGHADVSRATAMPRVAGTRVLALSHDDALLDALVALPPPLGDASVGEGALLVHGLLRQWASSEGALRGALRRRLARAIALESALADGCVPDGATLRRWVIGDDAVQLAFTALLEPADPGAAVLRVAVAAHADAVRSILRRLDDGVGRDAERAERLRQLRVRHAGERIVAFSSFAGTVRALWRLLRVDPAVAALVAEGGSVAGGPIARAELLDRFAPHARGRPMPRDVERVELLLATDLASEGVNLQDASVVVHLDLPWTPARLAQRVGRVARLGSSARVVHVYAMAPPAAAERVLAVEARLRAKLDAAARAIGVRGMVVPSCAPAGTGADRGGPARGRGRARRSAPQLVERLHARVRGWRGARGLATDARGRPAPLAAAVRAPVAGALALVRVDGECRLLAVRGRSVRDDVRAVARAVHRVDAGMAVPVEATCVLAVLRAVRRWRRRWRAAQAAAVDDVAVARARRDVAMRVSRSLAMVSRDARGEAARRGTQAWARAQAARGAHAEAALPGLLDAMLAASAPEARPAPMLDAPSAPVRRRRRAGRDRVVAVILLVRAPDDVSGPAGGGSG